MADLTGQALQHYKAAQEALKQGDLATSAREIAEMGRLLQQADAIEKGTPAVSPSPGVSLATLPRASPPVSSRASPSSR